MTDSTGCNNNNNIHGRMKQYHYYYHELIFDIAAEDVIRKIVHIIIYRYIILCMRKYKSIIVCKKFCVATRISYHIGKHNQIKSYENIYIEYMGGTNLLVLDGNQYLLFEQFRNVRDIHIYIYI